MKRKVAVAENEELAQEAKHVVLTRETLRAETNELFSEAEPSRKRDRSIIEKLFRNGATAQTGISPNLLPKTASAELPEPHPAPNVAAFFEREKTASVYTRFPELLTVQK